MDISPQDTAFNLASLINKKLNAAGKSVLHMSQKTGIPRTTLQRRLNTGVGLEVAELAAIADFFGTTVEALVTDAEKNNRTLKEMA